MLRLPADDQDVVGVQAANRPKTILHSYPRGLRKIVEALGAPCFVLEIDTGHWQVTRMISKFTDLEILEILPGFLPIVRDCLNISFFNLVLRKIEVVAVGAVKAD